MLDADSGIASVTLQRTGDKGLDDVVVRFTNGDIRMIQVKHTRTHDTLTFRDLVTRDGTKAPLLSRIATAWQIEELRAKGNCEAWLVTNRSAGSKSTAHPSLADFLDHLATKLPDATTLAELDIPPDWRDAWTKEWLPQLAPLDSTAQLKFMRNLRVYTSEEGLDELKNRLLARLEALFAVDTGTAEHLLALLDSALRKWSTSSRGKAEEITRDAAYERLCLVADSPVGEHELAPPTPFFGTRVTVGDEIACLVRTRAAPVILVVGEPGSGKTALLTWLANRRDPLIDARFHAYRPITPQNRLLPADAGRTATARALWSDLLLQIRYLARGHLAELQVPVHAGSLSVDLLRGHVLRLADALGRRGRRPFVIAIDGIDHAARAGANVDSFLTSLVPPDHVPDHVTFLLAGQQPEAYPRYPVWLRAPTKGLTRRELPRLSEDDTLQLVRSRLAAASTADHANAARDVWACCQGHTLSTVFAIDEAALAETDLSKLEGILSSRNIAAGIEAYYESIWSAITRPFHPSSTPIRLAACLCLMPVRATAATVKATVEPHHSGSADWGDLLRQLRPLVVEDNNGFRVAHNDVKVFLNRILQADTGLYAECASRIADHLMADGDVLARHAAAQSLFGIARRPDAQAALFTPAYVLEGHVIGQSLAELTEQALQAAEALALLADPDWNLAHAVATGLRTLEQLRASLRWRDAEDDLPRLASRNTPTKLVERGVLPLAEWSNVALTTALDDIAELHTLGEGARATSAFRRWFHELSPRQILTAQPSATTAEVDPGTQDAQRAVARKLGQLSATVGVLLPFSEDPNSDELEAAFASGLLTSAVDCTRTADFDSLLRRAARCYYYRDAERLLTHLVNARAWAHCKQLLYAISPGDAAPWPYRIQAAAAAALLGDTELRERWVTPLLTDRVATVSAASTFRTGADTDATHLTVIAWVALLFGIEEPYREASNIREEIATVFRATQHRNRDGAAVAQTLHAAALLGSLVRTARDAKPRALHVTLPVLGCAVGALMTTARDDAYHLPAGFAVVASSLVRGLSDCSARDPEAHAAIRSVLAERLRTGLMPGDLLETTWRTLAQAGQRGDLVDYADRCLGANGSAWREAPADRHATVRRLLPLLDEVGEHERASAARSRLAWVAIGYVGRKETALQRPYEWFLALANGYPACWEDEGARLFSISREASRISDNRLASDIEGAVLTAACIDGPASFARIVGAPGSLVGARDQCLISGLLGMVGHNRISLGDLRAIWAYSTGRLCWQVDDHRHRLAEVREALENAGRQIGATDLPELLRSAAPAEYACEPDPQRASRRRETEARGNRALTGLAADRAMQQVCNARDWIGVTAVLGEIASGQQEGAARAIEVAWSTLLTLTSRVWYFEEAGPAYAAIFPCLSPARRWEAVARCVASCEPDNPAYRSYTIAENVDYFCKLAALIEGREALQRGLRRLLDMHEIWLTGAGRLTQIARIPIADDKAEPGEWRPLFVDLLFQVLEFDEQSYVQSALRGIDRLLMLDSRLYARVVARAREASPDVRRRLLFVAEALAQRKEAAEFRAWLACEVGSASLDVGLAAWAALRAGRRALGESEPNWPRSSNERPLVVPVARPLLTRPATHRGLDTVVGRASSTILRQLEDAVGDVADLESDLAASIRDDPPQCRPRRARRPDFDDAVPSPEGDAELDRLFALLRVQEQRGRFEHVPVMRLAQALVPFVDPFVFLQTPRPCRAADAWPVDDSLDALFLSGESFGDTLAAAMVADLDPSVRLIAGTIRTFSMKRDVRVDVDHVVQRGVYRLHDDWRPSILNGRACLAFEQPDSLISIRGARDQEWLTQIVGGLHPLYDATLDFFPGRAWRDHLSWEPDANDPLTWARGRRRVAWFERLSGPIRPIHRGDFVHRQPSVARWVCVEDEWRRVTDILGFPLRFVRPDAREL